MKSNEVKLQGIKKAVSAVNNSCAEYVRIYANMKTGELSVCEYCDCNSWNDYGNDWMQVYSGHTPRSMWHSEKLTMAKLKETAENNIYLKLQEDRYYAKLEADYILEGGK